jgi:hypothetical protein
VEVGAIQEDAGALDEFGDNFTVLLHARRGTTALGLELPLIVGEPLGGLLHAALVLLVGEVCSVAATALDQFGRGPRQYALAAGAEDAGPVALEEGHVEHPGSLALGVLETHPLVGVAGY